MITVPDECMEMPEGLQADDRITVRFRDGYEVRGSYASQTWWQTPIHHATRITAYRIIKPAE